MYSVDLKLFRNTNNLSQNDLAKLFECKQSFISQIETGYRQIPQEFISILLASKTYDLSSIKNTKATLGENNTENYSNNSQGVPYFEDLDVTASLITSFQDYKEVPTFLIDYKHFNDCDAYLPVVGDSMKPKYLAGEIVAIKQIKNFETILWGETHLVITNDNANNLRTIKDVHFSRDESKLILRACNPDYAGDTYVNKSDVISMFIVKGAIKRNQL